MTCMLSIKDLSDSEIDRLRQVADSAPNWIYGQQIHTLLDAYEGAANAAASLVFARERICEIIDDLDGKGDTQDRIEAARRSLAALEAEL